MRYEKNILKINLNLMIIFCAGKSEIVVYKENHKAKK